MRCWRFDLQRNFARYLDGELDVPHTARIESHLLACGWCRTKMTRLRDGQRLAASLPRPVLQRDVWDGLESAIAAEERERTGTALGRAQPRWPKWQWAAMAVAMVTMLIAVAVRVATRTEFGQSGPVDAMVDHHLATERFQTVAISEIQYNTKPHVVAEGYVSELRVDPDGDLTFRLVEDLNHPEPFIVCEIIRPIRLSAPTLGSRIRVYGVSRYDNQPGREWHEVHPVLNIENVKP